MLKQNDVEYFLRREKEELVQAEQSENIQIRNIHLKLAEIYGQRNKSMRTHEHSTLDIVMSI